MNKYCIPAIIILLVYGCSGNVKPAVIPAPVQVEEQKTASFFPVTSFIRGQIITLDSLPVTPLQITIVKQKSDSVWMPKKDMIPLLKPFLEPVISETNLTKYFKETKFNDQTINAVTFTYDPVGIIPDSITLRHWDVYVDPERGNVTKVFMVKSIKENNLSFTQQLTWQTDKMAKISTILNKPGGDMELLKEVVFIWKF